LLIIFLLETRDIEAKTLSNPSAILSVGPKEHLHLTHLNLFLCAFEMTDNVVDESSTLVDFHDTAVARERNGEGD